jgi:hypothetical protein
LVKLVTVQKRTSVLMSSQLDMLLTLMRHEFVSL